MRIFLLPSFILVFLCPAFSQTTEAKKDEKEVTICHVKLLAVAANFRFAYRYSVRTDDKGSVTKVEQLGKDDFPKFVKDEEFIPCIESWKLNPSENYYVVFFLGTSSYLGKNYISISSKTEAIKINLPNIEMKLVVEEKKKK
ncbi:MAG TPA: hypothetical protein VNI84_20730 [Pyrinomonadaceae bacterium]|nr:hypothetical protein [Pyrinomonadaceae bacterium]